MSAQSLLARRYARWITITCFSLAIVTLLIGWIERSHTLPSGLLVGMKAVCWLSILVGAIYGYFPAKIFPYIAEIHGRWVGNRTALLDAAKKKDPEFLKEIFKTRKSARVQNIYGMTPLHSAAFAGNDFAVEHLLSLGADPNARTLGDLTPFTLALHSGNLKVIELLKNAKAAFVPTRDAGVTQFMVEAATGSTASLTAKLSEDQKGVDARSQFGFTALHFAAVFGKADNAAFLLKCGATPDVITPDKQTMLHLSAANGHNNMVLLALQTHPGMLDFADVTGSTPLMLAAVSGHEAVVQTLLAAGADLLVKNLFGQTAEDYAKSENQRAVLVLLGNHLRVLAQRNTLNAAVQSNAVSITHSAGSVAPANSASAVSSTDSRMQTVDQIFACLEADRLLSLDGLGKKLGTDIAEFFHSAKRSKVRLWWGSPETGKTTFAKRLSGNGRTPSPLLTPPSSSPIVYLMGQEVVERKFELKDMLSALTAHSIVFFDDADNALDPEQGMVSASDAKLHIQSLLTSLSGPKPIYLILIGNFAKRRGNFLNKLDASHLNAALGENLAERIEHSPWEFKHLGEKELLSAMISALGESRYQLDAASLGVLYAQIMKKNPTRPLREFEKIFDIIVREVEVEPDTDGIKKISHDMIKEMFV